MLTVTLCCYLLFAFFYFLLHCFFFLFFSLKKVSELPLYDDTMPCSFFFSPKRRVLCSIKAWAQNQMRALFQNFNGTVTTFLYQSCAQAKKRPGAVVYVKNYKNAIIFFTSDAFLLFTSCPDLSHTHRLNSQQSTMNNIKRSIPSRQRKSTLTQQQKNKKRQRATPKQLSVLRSEFLINSTPNAKIREEIGRKIDMTERSVQIWFQNKRAKAKQFARKGSGTYPSNMQFMGNPNGQPYYNNPPMMLSPMASPLSHSPFQQVNIASGYPTFTDADGNIMDLSNAISLSCSFIKIGSWQRVSSGDAQDLDVSFSVLDNSITYTMTANNTGFKLRYSMSQVKNIHYSSSTENAMLGDVFIHVTMAPSFYIQTPLGSGHWMGCPDFSEMKQASYVFLHKLSGHALQLQMQLYQIAAVEPTKVTGINVDKILGQQTNLGCATTQNSPVNSSAAMNCASELSSPGSSMTHASVIPEKVQSVSMPALFESESMIVQDNSSDDELFLNINISAFSGDSQGEDLWTNFPQGPFDVELKDKTNEHSPENTALFVESSPVSPSYIADSKDASLFDDSLVDFSNEGSNSDSMSTSSLATTLATEFTEIGIQNHMMPENNIFSINPSSLEKGEHSDYLYAKLHTENHHDGETTGLDNYDNDSALSALIQV